MGIGQHTIWIVVDEKTARAVTSEKDHRRALEFVSEEAAASWAKRLNAKEPPKTEVTFYLPERYFVVEVPR